MHTDVGGGYEKKKLSDIALKWMVREALGKGLLIYPDHTVETDPNPDGFMHDSRDTWWKKKTFPKLQRTWPTDKLGKPVVHESVKQRSMNERNIATPAYDPWILQDEYDVEV